MSRYLVLAMVTACAVDAAPSALPEAAGPPGAVALQWQGDATRGGDVTFRATPDPALGVTSVGFLVGTQLGQGACPPQLGGACVGVTGQTMWLGTKPVRGGVADKRWTIPLRAPDRVHAQAIGFGPGGNVVGDIVSLDVLYGVLQDGDTCQSAPDACDAGLSCCYPCGIQGCQNMCMVTCDPADPACFDGCYAFP